MNTLLTDPEHRNLTFCGDSCDRCDAIDVAQEPWDWTELPERVVDSNEQSVKLAYSCRHCGAEWQTWWTRELAVLHSQQMRREMIDASIAKVRG